MGDCSIAQATRLMENLPATLFDIDATERREATDRDRGNRTVQRILGLVLHTAEQWGCPRHHADIAWEPDIDATEYCRSIHYDIVVYPGIAEIHREATE